MSVFMLYPHFGRRRRLRPPSRRAREVPFQPALVAVAVPAPRLLHRGVARPQARAERPLEVRDERRRREAAVGPPLPRCRHRPVRVGQRRAHAWRRRRRRKGGRGIEVHGPPRGRGYRRLRWSSGRHCGWHGGRGPPPGRVQADDAPRGRRVVVKLCLQRRGAYDGTRVERRPRLEGRRRPRRVRGSSPSDGLLAPPPRLGSRLVRPGAAAAPTPAGPPHQPFVSRSEASSLRQCQKTTAERVARRGASARSWHAVPEPSEKSPLN